MNLPYVGIARSGALALVFVVMDAGCSAPAGGQLSEGVQPQPPIGLRVRSVDATSSSTVATLELSNLSTKEIVGYIVGARFNDGEGRARFSTSFMNIHPEHLPHGQHDFQGGSTWTTEVKLPAGETATSLAESISVDFVLYRDGSGWGPDKQGESKRLYGFIAGYRGERARLRRLLEKQGTGAVADDLRPEAAGQ